MLEVFTSTDRHIEILTNNSICRHTESVQRIQKDNKRGNPWKAITLKVGGPPVTQLIYSHEFNFIILGAFNESKFDDASPRPASQPAPFETVGGTTSILGQRRFTNVEKFIMQR